MHPHFIFPFPLEGHLLLIMPYFTINRVMNMHIYVPVLIYAFISLQQFQDGSDVMHWMTMYPTLSRIILIYANHPGAVMKCCTQYGNTVKTFQTWGVCIFNQVLIKILPRLCLMFCTPSCTTCRFPFQHTLSRFIIRNCQISAV